ncbi:unnamed protein product [Zymoseptoria tritici ST99CH_3D1]|uniref:F-box domain-containing protein n=3 Tax=Zymoseptoria tritici TaxID=1047171 RepID=F9X268_ZYMTI|nr:uncharacterized protein MYCGRDRAFT_90539 [Zymoseptoria tritici IPO323]EGP90670.1 hypothetical protein MYCGRDRAFT_90539 [Zymoseptoria tritici IPO323]SMQ47348.1 unnamed protein product [Zymoseptoria tritici ST99CH_3D7]SMR45882.1 unnamed protein product [Zymoseptoria tritici ST99CH_1E4]SMR47131.1 unnamed protein product [Zymoseptoria tritici ST99CH_3D1]
MASLLDLPRELRDMISNTLIINNQPFRLTSTTQLRTNSPTSGLDQTCRQFHAEYAHLLRRAAFTSGTKTVVPVHNFDFSQMLAFAKGLRPHEVSAASRNRNLVVNLFVFDPQALNVQSLVEWVKLCEKTGLEVEYVLQWNAFDVKTLVKGVEGAVGGFREGGKIVKALKTKSVGGWSWEGYCKEVKQGRK